MLPDRYYVAEVRKGSKHRRLYFYASTEVLTDPDYGYTVDDSWIEQAYEAVVYEVREVESVLPSGFEAGAGADVLISDPREIRLEEAVQQDTGVNTHVIRAIDLAKREIGKARHPIRVTWYWQTSEEWGDEAAVYLILTDDVATRRQGFFMQDLKDEALMKDQIRRLYQDLLAKGTRDLIKNLLGANAGAGKG
jgi:hypothetical protein